MSEPVIHVSQEVQDAVRENRPVVALESTIFTHGLPRPRNLDVALEAEAGLRAQGVTPATIGVFNGVPTVGLSTEQITELSNTDNIAKASLRDLPVVRALGIHGGTTVAATAFLAHHAGVKVFSTGGLGGVHHGASETFDESADMTTLAQIPILVISAGVKSILDIPATLERFETLNIPVIGYGTTKYPGFYVTDSGFSIGYSVDTPEEVAAVVTARDELGLPQSVLLANPVAADKQLPPEQLDDILARAWAEAEKQGISGNASTPFLLDFIQKDTKGVSLDVNVEVYRGNVSLGGLVATALTR
ncbi:pseudouridine-5'-phosphate glycosidase [Salinibacterium sp. NSLL150]|uniref:pseudouridine-5'-phosphate glycosidase n=1 Tax=unclassified Salinibacterium TaxID=2632331 RepID=UPI0018CD2A5A|nr:MULTISPECIES: pseudouridine-5'-phosphate glycosidase [unclassified Salinibacterium]MBH0098038.1 pseudouridine-5'-phosphate glycosidase [Salinibacterium sp. NSLL35]MBH0100793.1 pseudouridine-5'-phosphate glycosidase [Salinibacterium sp. NSLL150]MBH0103552.1 pseudouridine-5'-phosphate glycosidase [Salinibacterium sp. NSLL16]MBH0106313.1 pseudouridine-5'-phosphate glycosidase [Salinibacterium sp. NSLL17]MBH0109914.1 pseudouridine-5'-phosphate glycosidase [Salinibacterium sp. NG22]